MVIVVVVVVVERKVVVVVVEGKVVVVAILEHPEVVALLEIASFGGLGCRSLTPDHDHPSVRLQVGRIILLKINAQKAQFLLIKFVHDAILENKFRL